jgi:hypothetical protein
LVAVVVPHVTVVQRLQVVVLVVVAPVQQPQGVMPVRRAQAARAMPVELVLLLIKVFHRRVAVVVVRRTLVSPQQPLLLVTVVRALSHTLLVHCSHLVAVAVGHTPQEMARQALQLMAVCRVTQLPLHP